MQTHIHFSNLRNNSVASKVQNTSELDNQGLPFATAIPKEYTLPGKFIHRKKAFNSLLILVALTAILTRTNPPTLAEKGGEKVVPMTVRGYVAGTYFTPPAGSVPSTTSASYFVNATVCADLNNNAVCDADEASTTTDSRGRFVLHSLKQGPVIA